MATFRGARGASTKPEGDLEIWNDSLEYAVRNGKHSTSDALVTWGQSETTEGGFAEAALDIVFKTIEGAYLAEELDEQYLADYAASVQRSAEACFDGSAPGANVYLPHPVYLELPQAEALAKTDALHQAIEDTGGLVLKDPSRRLGRSWRPAGTTRQSKAH